MEESDDGVCDDAKSEMEQESSAGECAESSAMESEQSSYIGTGVSTSVSRNKLKSGQVPSPILMPPPNFAPAKFKYKNKTTEQIVTSKLITSECSTGNKAQAKSGQILDNTDNVDNTNINTNGVKDSVNLLNSSVPPKRDLVKCVKKLPETSNKCVVESKKKIFTMPKEPEGREVNGIESLQRFGKVDSKYFSTKKNEIGSVVAEDMCTPMRASTPTPSTILAGNLDEFDEFKEGSLPSESPNKERKRRNSNRDEDLDFGLEDDDMGLDDDDDYDKQVLAPLVQKIRRQERLRAIRECNSTLGKSRKSLKYPEPPNETTRKGNITLCNDWMGRNEKSEKWNCNDSSVTSYTNDSNTSSSSAISLDLTSVSKSKYRPIPKTASPSPNQGRGINSNCSPHTPKNSNTVFM